MDQKQLLKQMIEFNRNAFDNTFASLVMLQEQAEKMTNTMLDQATWLPEDGKKVIGDWVAAYKNGREQFKAQIDESFKKVEDYFENS